MRGIEILPDNKRMEQIDQYEGKDRAAFDQSSRDQIKWNGGQGEEQSFQGEEGCGVRNQGIEGSQQDQKRRIMGDKIRSADGALEKTAMDIVPLDLAVEGDVEGT